MYRKMNFSLINSFAFFLLAGGKFISTSMIQLFVWQKQLEQTKTVDIH